MKRNLLLVLVILCDFSGLFFVLSTLGVAGGPVGVASHNVGGVNIAVGVPGYHAAVLEHLVVKSERCMAIQDGKERATCVKMENLDIYEEKTKEAARQRAEIIVFPEEGIDGAFMNRTEVLDYAETIPNPGTAHIPCDDPDLARTAQSRYSCLAKRYKLYVVGHCADRQSVRHGVPGDYLYNTAVAYDPRGVLVARYHKYNLFSFEQLVYNRPDPVEISYFDTHFGRVGIFVCFDVLFKKPAYELVEKYNVTDIAFPTAWIDELPMWSAVGVHSSWAMTMKVNFLSANYRKPDSGVLGSGIYSPDGPLVWTRDTNTNGSILLVTWVPKRHDHPGLTMYFSDIFFPENQDTFQAKLFHDLHTFTLLDSGTRRKKVCMNNFCCKLKYKANISPNEKYALGVFSGLHTEAQQYLHFQNCIVTKCAGMDNASCGQKVENAETKFESFHIEGNFDAEYIFPQVVVDDVQLVGVGQFESVLRGDAYISSRQGFDKPLLFAGMQGRIYDVTPPPDESGK